MTQNLLDSNSSIKLLTFQLSNVRDAFARREGLIVISQSEFSTNAMGLRVSISYWLHGDRLLTFDKHSPFILRAISVSASSLQLCLGAKGRPTDIDRDKFHKEIKEGKSYILTYKPKPNISLMLEARLYQIILHILQRYFC